MSTLLDFRLSPSLRSPLSYLGGTSCGPPTFAPTSPAAPLPVHLEEPVQLPQPPHPTPLRVARSWYHVCPRWPSPCVLWRCPVQDLCGTRVRDRAEPQPARGSMRGPMAVGVPPSHPPPRMVPVVSLSWWCFPVPGVSPKRRPHNGGVPGYPAVVLGGFWCHRWSRTDLASGSIPELLEAAQRLAGTTAQRLVVTTAQRLAVTNHPAVGRQQPPIPAVGEAKACRRTPT